MKQKKRNIQQKEISDTRKDLYKRLLYIGIGIIPMIFVWGSTGPERFIGLAGFIFSMYQVIIIIYMSPFIVDDFFPPRTAYESSTKSFDKFMYSFSSGFFLASLIFLIFEIRWIDNTINGTKLFWYSGLCGISIASLLTMVFKKKTPSLYYESKRRYTVHFGLFVGFFLILPAITSFINHHWAVEEIVNKNYQIQRKGTGGTRHTAYWLFLKLEDNSEERFEVSQNLYDNVFEGEKVKLYTKKGKLDFDFVEKFEIIDK